MDHHRRSHQPNASRGDDTNLLHVCFARYMDLELEHPRLQRDTRGHRSRIRCLGRLCRRLSIVYHLCWLEKLHKAFH